MEIPYGESEYRKIKTENFIYVDKTMYLEKLEKAGSKILYLRPKRFGKTLFTSMMQCYYDINSSNEFDILFKDTYVYNHPTKNKNNYYILKLDFSGMSVNSKNLDCIVKSFLEKIYNGLIEFLNHYNFSYEIDYNLYPAELLGRFLTYFNSLNLDYKLYIIIDEYDNFTNSILSNNTDMFKKILGNEGFVKAFYARIKEYCTLGVVDRVFITGVCSISLDSMTSGFNIATNITTDSRFNSMTALTHEEVRNLLSNFDDSDKHFEIMLENYDGYNFNEEISYLVFNPTLTMYYLKTLIDTGNIPRHLLDSNILSSYEQIKNIIKLGDYREILMDIFDNGEISANLKVNFDVNQTFNRDDIISLLFYFGYLTINRMDYFGLVFNIPNKVIESVFNTYFLEVLKELDIVIDDNCIREGLISMANDGSIDLITKVVSSIISGESFRDYMNINEYVIKHTYLTILNNNNIFDMYSEYEVEDGYVDLYFVSKSDLSKYNIIIELKYLKVKDKDNYNAVYKEALEQINKYSKDRRINKNNLCKYIVIFTGSSYKVEKVI